MTLKHIEEYRDSELARRLSEKIRRISRRNVRLMEVCGTHTVSIFRSGIRSLLPPPVSLLSGPGCPVCVTDQAEIDAFIELAKQKDVIVTTFGDLMRVPGSASSLQRERAEGRDIRVVYSTVDALAIARSHPGRQVVFLGVGFETTAPTIAAAILSAAEARLDNFSVISAHKTVPQALEALLALDDVRIDGFILPGHVSVIIGLNAYRPFFDRHRTRRRWLQRRRHPRTCWAAWCRPSVCPGTLRPRTYSRACRSWCRSRPSSRSSMRLLTVTMVAR